MVAGLSNLSVGGYGQVGPLSVVPARDRTWLEHEWRRPALTISERGEPNSVTWDCPGSNQDTVYETDWFHLPDVPDFLVCTRCHDRYLKNESLAATAFTKTRRINGRCRFNVPRITSVLLPHCLQFGTFEPLKEYMRRRLELKDCKATVGAKGRENYAWYVIAPDTNDIMKNFVACEACHEDYVLASTYAGEFMNRLERFPFPHPADDTWYCDMHFPYIKRSFVIFSQNNAPFADWVAKATRRFQLPACEGTAVESSSREWVRPRDPVKDLVICEKCYFDKIAWTAVQEDFEYIPIAKPHTGSEWLDESLGYRQEPPTAWTW